MSLLSISSGVGIGIDVAIVGLVLILALIGLRKGFIKSVLAMLSSIAEIVISVFCASPFAKLINKIYNVNGWLGGKLCKSIAGMGEFYSTEIPAGVSGADLASSIPSSTNGVLQKLMQYVLKPLQASEVQGSTVAEIVSGAFASIIVTVVAGIILFILFKIVVALISKLFDKIAQKGVLGGLNRILGFAFGFVKGALIVVVIAFVMTILTVIPKVNTKVYPLIQDHTKVAKIVYNHTDEFVEKHLIDNKIVQKWIDSMWENKYKTNNTELPEVTPDGTSANPYKIDLIQMGNTFTSNYGINFDEATEVYCYFDVTTIEQDTFTLAVQVENAEWSLYEREVLDTALTEINNLDKTKNYIIKITKSNEVTEVELNIVITPNI